MNIFQKIREVKLPFLAVVAALAFGGIVAPASAAGTSITSADVLSTLVQKGVVSLPTASTIAATEPLETAERIDGAYVNAEFASAGSPLTIQAGDKVKISATYTNLDSATTATTFNAIQSYLAVNVTTQSQATHLSAMDTVAGSNNTVTKEATFSGLNAGSYVEFNLSANFSIADAAAVAGDRLRVVTSFALVRGGSEITLTPVSGISSSRSYLRFTKVNTIDYTIGANVEQVMSIGNFCIYNAENGVGNGTQIEVTLDNPGTAGAPGQIMLQPTGILPPARNGNVFTLVMPSSTWTRTNVMVQMYKFNSLTQGNTWTPTITAVIAGTTTNVLDRCFRQQQVTPAPSQVRTTASVRPLPQINFAANPVNGVSARPTADTRKGTLTIEGSNLSDLTSITIGGKAATFTVKDGKLDIKLPAGVTGFPEVVMTNASGSITMQNAIEIYAPTVQKLTKFVGERLTLAGMEVLENLYINNKTATALEATVVVAPDATEAEIAKAVAAATKAVTYIDKVGKRIVRTAVTVSKTGEAGTKPAIEMSFTK
jgi:hypothetical protein